MYGVNNSSDRGVIDVTFGEREKSEVVDYFLSAVYHETNEQDAFWQTLTPLLHRRSRNRRDDRRHFPVSSNPGTAADTEPKLVPYSRANTPTYT